METTTDNDHLSDFYNGIEEFAQEFVGNPDYRKNLPKNPKIIHDPLWGTIKLEAWEVAVLDLPLFQRLRQIHQTSLVSYVFPGCVHTRFEHTLGVLQQTQKLIDAVNRQYSNIDKKKYNPDTIRDLRLAALFHDCGHSCFSHISEDLYEACPDMKAFLDSGLFSKCHPHEAFSAIILKSRPVKDFLTDIETEYDIKFNIEKAVDAIIGRYASGLHKIHYETQVINGPFDADKLDYIFRDAHYSGIPVGLDLDRLWASCMVSHLPTGDDVLTLHQASVAPLEQILFSKINLFSIVYQHPKVRAAEKMFQGIIENIKKNKDCYFNVSGRMLDLNRATDYLRLTDEGFFSEALHRDKNDPLHKKIHDIRYRRFLVRALTISDDTVGDNCEDSFMQLRKLNQKGSATYKAKREIAEMIIQTAGLQNKLDIQNVWVDLPSDPSFGEADRTWVRTTSKSYFRKVSELFPIHYWSELYQKYKWRGHVFCPEEYQQKIHEAALEVFNDEFKIKFKQSAGESSHVMNPKSTS